MTVTWEVLNYIEKLLILVSGPNGYYAALNGIPIGILNVSVGLEICIISAEIKYINQWSRKRKKSVKIILLARIKLNTLQAFVSKAFSDSEISFDEFLYVNNVLKEYKNQSNILTVLN